MKSIIFSQNRNCFKKTFYKTCYSIRLIMASLSILLLTVMSGCSDSDIREKFIGDWKGKNLNDEPVMIKIKKQDDKYVVFGGDNQLPVDYNKDENSFIGKEDSHTLEIKYQKSDDKLIFSFDGKIVECERIK